MTGLFFGSFDPVHIGHINVVTAALNSGFVDNVIVVPAFRSVWKNTETPFKYRYILTIAAFEHIPNVVVTDIEERLSEGNPLPTCEVIEYFQKTLSEFVIITTSETYVEIPKWKNGEEIMRDNKFLIVDVAHFDREYTIKKGDLLIHAPNITICSTNLRQKIKGGKILHPFIPDNVIKMIKSLHLYE